MARRGATLVDIKTTEELDELLKEKCLHVVNVYDGFFGPCNAIATNLRDFKIIEAGDDLQVTTVNVDQIDVLKRFRNKSEPVYLMILDGQVVNSYYGTNVTELIDIIKQEIEYFKSGETNRQKFDLREMSALEAQRFRTMREEMIFNRKQDQMKKHQLVYDYRMRVTNDIMENVTEVGVTVFMPHVADETLIEKLDEPAQAFNMQLKTHVIAKITRKDLEMINFDGENMSPLLFNHVRDREVLIVAWKMTTGELKPINEILGEFVKSMRDEVEFDVKNKKEKKKGKQKKNVKEKEDIPEEEEPKVHSFKLPMLSVSVADLKREKPDPIQIEPIDLQFIESEKDIIRLVSESITAFTEQSITKLHHKCIKDTLIELIEETKPQDDEMEVPPEQKMKKKKKKAAKPVQSSAKGEVIFDPNNKDVAYIYPVWTPPTPRSNASILFLYFRKLLSFFLPMDRPGADRFVIVVFPAEKHEEILEFMKDHHMEYHNDILAHGMFRGFVDGENFANTKLICKTGIEYRMETAEPGDKMILKVVSNSEALLALVDLDPEFVSQNEFDGEVECDVIFPLGYISISEEQMEEEMKLEDDPFGEGNEENEAVDGAEENQSNADQNETSDT